MKTEHGFTLVELMVTLAVAAILLTVGVPSMTNLIKNNRLTAATNAFVSSLNLARSEAVKQGRNAVLCVGDQNGCAAGNWAGGWTVLVDSDRNNSFDPAEVQRVSEPLSNTVTVTTASNSFQFDATGAVDNTGTFKLCDDRAGNLGRQLQIFTTGSVLLTTQVPCP